MKQKRILANVLEELALITLGVGKGLLTVVTPLPKSDKPKWCCCNKCGGWHYLTK